MEDTSTQNYFTENAQVTDPSKAKECAVNFLIFGTCFGGFFVISGLVGNTMTIAIMGRDRKKSSTINCLFMLAIADSFILLNYGAILIPNGIYAMVSEHYKRMNFYRFTWTYFTEAARIFNQVSVLITMLVTFQRYVSVCMPHRAKNLCSVKLVNILVGFSYLISIIYFLPNFFLYYLAKNSSDLLIPQVHPITKSPLYKLLYSTIGFSLLTYVIPVATLGFLSIQIIRAMRRQSLTVPPSQGASNARKDLTRSSIAIVILCLFCQSFSMANRILMWIFDKGYVQAVSCGGQLYYFMLLPHVMIVINSACNFIVYVTLSKGFMNKFQRLFATKNQVAPTKCSATRWHYRAGLGDSDITNDGPILIVKDIDLTSETPSFLLQHSIPVHLDWVGTNRQDIDTFELEHLSDRQFVRLEPPRPRIYAKIRANDGQHIFSIKLTKWNHLRPFSSLTLNEVPRLETILHQKEEREFRLAIQMTTHLAHAMSGSELLLHKEVSRGKEYPQINQFQEQLEITQFATLHAQMRMKAMLTWI
ncbi:hypothetical protein CAPTEDRAFT_194782 [Capitella teleta]|uniref:G-protein coupled receptors family 1 profile domain-containing protein n=1 Tax=Capitella teleta TaxID=283909 RepID=R7TST6_CAPTE|nr:hypothetical protein CAPTEDRAFT_194782 [Capitella teleta]|eukprot:ELT96953.1 hypothetical protein CAPTEDRAFT_194782 [Capitella teleta]